ncbi:PREDICTED: organic cation transporter protein-like [Nicrophorus vespilloides]|uniref:Organic cation transporter protein-like n=1 Tax=Nicrophorus vespilloides TaxID=110193 RepID=A0ABM1MSP9_NICVS|nr:PREDICTED: organic cation transporter protein-like [Nicrophorus vespilloides]
MPPQENFPPQERQPEEPKESCSNLEHVQPPSVVANKQGGFSNTAFVSESLPPNLVKKPGDGEDSEDFEFDDLLPHIGEFGRYQVLLFFMMVPFACFVAWVYFTQIFITLTPEEHWCWVPELANFTTEERLNLAIPKGEKCRMYAVNYTEILQQGVVKPDPSWPTVACRNGWEYNYTDIPYKTIASELDWVCEQDGLPTLAQAIFFCGAILGGLVFGWVADRHGRIPALVGTNLIGATAGIATAYCNSFWSFCVCRFLVGMAFDNCFTMMYILVLEYVGPKWRTFVANMSIAIFFTFASTILPWIALWVADWRMLSITTSAPLFICLLTPWIVPESARWLASQGKVEKAVSILKKFERINKKNVDEKLYNEFTASCLKAEKEDADKSYSVLDLFKTPRLRKITILLILIWMAISLVFDGHVRNVGSLGLDIFVTFSVASFTEFPADTFLTIVLDRWGRRWLACGTMVVSGIFSLLAITVPLGIASATFAIIGRFAVNISYNIGLQYAAELLPTVVRAQGVALIHIMGYVASIVAPFIVYLANISTSLPLLILGIIGILGGMLALFLPETLDHELPQTLQDGEEFGKDQKFFEFPCMARKPMPEPKVDPFKRAHLHLHTPTRASFRGEIRSSLIHRDSIRSRKSMAENAI